MLPDMFCLFNASTLRHQVKFVSLLDSMTSVIEPTKLSVVLLHFPQAFSNSLFYRCRSRGFVTWDEHGLAIGIALDVETVVPSLTVFFLTFDNHPRQYKANQHAAHLNCACRLLML
jgi:hypothetical protein